MAGRIKVGIIYKNDENWIGGTYYIQNLVFALNTLPDIHKPELIILCATENEFFEIKQSSYPYLTWKKLVIQSKRLPFIKKAINKIYQAVKNKDLYPQPLCIDTGESEKLFPAYTGITNKKIKNIFWIPDFQEQYLPQFFSANELKNRSQSHFFIAKSNEQAVFSSKDSFATFSRLFPESVIKKHLLHFAVTHPSYTDLEMEALKNKFNIRCRYFFAPNQLWKHKNQIVVLKAVKKLKEEGITDFLVLFSGKEQDYRNPDYVPELKQFVEDNSLGDCVHFLGFIDRKEQLKLMSEAIAIIQPSLFEGWSTVVEDAKALNQWTIASDLPVHKEQLSYNVSFFPPNDETELAVIMKDGIEKGFEKINTDYNRNIRAFAEDFLEIISSN